MWNIYLSKNACETSLETIQICARLVPVSAGGEKNRGCICSLMFQNVLLKDLLFCLNISVPLLTLPKTRTENRTPHPLWRFMNERFYLVKRKLCFGGGGKIPSKQH